MPLTEEGFRTFGTLYAVGKLFKIHTCRKMIETLSSKNNCPDVIVSQHFGQLFFQSSRCMQDSSDSMAHR